MPKVLLVNPAFNIAKENYDSSISVGLLCIATYLDWRGLKVVLVDGARQKNYLDIIKTEAAGCDYVGVSVMTTQIANALKLTEQIKQLNPGAKIVWGGSHPSFFIEQTAKHPLIDLVCYGEGEEIMFELASGKAWTNLPGIAYKDQRGQVKVNPPAPLVDPQRMPLFNWGLVAGEILNNLELIPTLTSRGCPHRCAFCINAILKNRWRPRTVEQVVADLETINNKPYFRGKKLRFWDENFFVDIRRAKEVIEAMLAKNLTRPWETTVRANYLRPGMIDDAFMERLKRSGCYLLSFGAESGSPHILTKIQKDITAEEILNSARLCLRHDIIPQYSFMIGLPGESKADMMLTLRLIDKLLKLDDRVQVLGPQAFRPYPGSTLYEECLKSGWQAPGSLEQWAHLAEHELSYLTVQNFPWVKHKNFVESMEAYVRFGAHNLKSALGSSVKAKRLLKLAFVLICQLRWKLKFFSWPIEFKLAKRFVTK